MSFGPLTLPPVRHGSTSVTKRVFLSHSSTGAGLGGLSGSSSGLFIQVLAQNSAGYGGGLTDFRQSVANIQTIAAIGTYAAPSANNIRFGELDAGGGRWTGWYELQFADGTWSQSNLTELYIHIFGATNLRPAVFVIPVVQYNPQDPVRLGLTALPNAAAQANGGLYTRGTGAGQIAQDANGRININMMALRGNTSAAENLESAFDGGAYNVGGGGIVADLVDAPNATAVSAIQNGLSTYDGSDTSGTTTLLGRLTNDRASYIDKLNVSGTLAHTNNADTFKADVGGLATIDGNVDTLLLRLTSSRADSLDNLDVGGPVASQADVNSLNLSSSRRVVLKTVVQYERPETGSTLYTVEARTYDGAGAAVDADETPDLAVVGSVSGDLSANLSAPANPEIGVYLWEYTVADDATVEPLRFAISVEINSDTFTQSALTQVVDLAAATWTTIDASRLASIYNKLPSRSYLLGGTASTGAIVTADLGLNSANLDTQLGVLAEKTDLPDNFSALGINASGHVQRVVLVDTTTANTDMRGTDSALLASGYTAPLTAQQTRDSLLLARSAGTLVVNSIDYQLGALFQTTGTTAITFSGISSLGNWLRLIARKDANFDGADLALSQINNSGIVLPLGTYNSTTDSLEAIRDRGDNAWTGDGGSIDPQNIRDAMLLAPSDDIDPEEGSIDNQLSAIGSGGGGGGENVTVEGFTEGAIAQLAGIQVSVSAPTMGDDMVFEDVVSGDNYAATGRRLTVNVEGWAGNDLNEDGASIVFVAKREGTEDRLEWTASSVADLTGGNWTIYFSPTAAETTRLPGTWRGQIEGRFNTNSPQTIIARAALQLLPNIA